MNEYSARIGRLRSRLAARPSLCVERGALLTEAYRETEGCEPALRQALALERVLAGVTVAIDGDELLAGRVTKYWRGAALLPEIDCRLLREITDGAAENAFTPVSPGEQAVIKDMLEYWNGRCLKSMWDRKLPERLRRRQLAGQITEAAFCARGSYLAPAAPDYEKLLRTGLLGIREEIEREISALDLTVPEDFEKLQYLNAMLVSNKAAVDFSMRYSALAARQAASCPDPARRAELEELARICAKVPANPAGSYYEAVQSIAMAWTIINIEGRGGGLCFGRLDQLLYPYYKRDKAAGVLTDDLARALISMLCLKAAGAADPAPDGGVGAVAAHGGGLDAQGRDAVNELSFLCLEAALDAGLPQAALAARISKKTPGAFAARAVEAAGALEGGIKFVSDETVLRQLLHDGCAPEDARGYVISGCGTVTIPGKSLDTPGCLVNMPLLLELALNDGRKRSTGEQAGPRTGDPRAFTAYEQLWNAFTIQCEDVLPAAVILRSSDRYMYFKNRPVPFLSSLFDGPAQKGRDVWEAGSRYATSSVSPAGALVAGDCLAAVKKVVFEDRAITMDELIDALEANFEGHEKTLRLLSGAPRYGGDSDEVDYIVNDVLLLCADILSRYTGAGGARTAVSPAPPDAGGALGLEVSALPDGRRAFLPLAEDAVSPERGGRGPEAARRSAAKLGRVRFTNASVFTMRLNPAALKDGESVKKTGRMLRAILESGGFYVQLEAGPEEAPRREPEKRRGAGKNAPGRPAING